MATRFQRRSARLLAIHTRQKTIGRPARVPAVKIRFSDASKGVESTGRMGSSIRNAISGTAAARGRAIRARMLNRRRPATRRKSQRGTNTFTKARPAAAMNPHGPKGPLSLASQGEGPRPARVNENAAGLGKRAAGRPDLSSRRHGQGHATDGRAQSLADPERRPCGISRVQECRLRLARRVGQRTLAPPARLAGGSVENERRVDDQGRRVTGRSGKELIDARHLIGRGPEFLQSGVPGAEAIGRPHQQLVAAVAVEISSSQGVEILSGHLATRSLLARGVKNHEPVRPGRIL